MEVTQKAAPVWQCYTLSMLTLYITVPTFINSEKEAFWNHSVKRNHGSDEHFLLSHNVSYQVKEKMHCLSHTETVVYKYFQVRGPAWLSGKSMTCNQEDQGSSPTRSS